MKNNPVLPLRAGMNFKLGANMADSSGRGIYVPMDRALVSYRPEIVTETNPKAPTPE